MKVEKKYFSISEVAKILGIKEHVIRHWDSIDPKTKKIRIENLSIRTKGGTRFFNKDHIKKISRLKNILKENGKRNHSLDLAHKIVSQEKLSKQIPIDIDEEYSNSDINNEKYLKIRHISKKLKTLISSK